MEKNVAVLMADLSGYTALTETHGSAAAADLIDKYIAIVENCLVGDCRLHERAGDEIMIISSSPDHLVAAALMILRNTSNEENFLQVHGGLHYGKALQRANSYFGSAINLTSRIAAKANAGRILCSDEFVNALSDKSAFPLISKGCYSFKNISTQKEVFELGIEEKTSFSIDPICRMLILEQQHAIRHPTEGDQYFCSFTCLEMYNQRATVSLN
ncbi:MAG: adenylate/guanylate cyclase domain-containing protein [Bacteroidota bacterium]